MTAFAFGEAAGLVLARQGSCAGGRGPARSGAVHRTGQPVRRDSMEAGTFEGVFFQVPAKGEPDRLVRTARAALDAGRRLKRAARAENRELSGPERALAALTAGAVRVFEELCTLARLNAGRVYPSYDHLAQATALGRATVARALHVLEQAGFLVRQRRFARVEGGDSPGPRYAQTSNAYRPLLPGKLLALLPRRFRPAPTPPCVLQHQADQAEELAAMRATLTCRELAETSVGGTLGRMLAKLGAAIDSQQRESHSHPEPRLRVDPNGIKGVGLVGRQRPA